jgi:hypothetical protein
VKVRQRVAFANAKVASAVLFGAQNTTAPNEAPF